MRTLILAAIRGYQRYVSPHKGFCCAYRKHTGRQSCSALGFRAVRRYGVLQGLKVLRRRMYLCGVAYRRFSVSPRHPFGYQRGFCDIGCDVPCDCDCHLPSLDGCFSCADFCDCGCDWPSRDRKNEQDQYVHIPPKASSNGSPAQSVMALASHFQHEEI